MADSQGRSPYDTGYDPYSDPDSGLYGQNPPDTSAGGTQAAPSPTTPPAQNPPATDGSGAKPSVQGASDNNELGALNSLLLKLGDPQAAVDAFNKQFPNSTLKPAYYANAGKGVIGVQGQPLPYLTAPGTTAGQTGWQFGGVPGGDSAGGGGTGAGSVGSYAALTRPDALAQPYTPAKFKVPGVADLLADPGYLAGEQSMQRGLERSAAAKGSILDGGFAGRALPRALGDYTGNAYRDLVNRSFTQFQGANQDNLAARQLNENDYNTDVTNNLNQYLTRYGAYQDLIKNDLSYADLGLRATQSGNPGPA